MALETPELEAAPLGLDSGIAVARRPRHWFLSPDVVIPAGVIVFAACACFVWPLVYHVPSPINGLGNTPNLFPFSPGHILGTDTIGNDIMSRILYGGRTSLEVGVGAAGLGMALGGLLGAFAGLSGGAVDAVIMRILDMLLSIPSVVMAIVITQYLGRSEVHVIWAISFFAIPSFARLGRAQTLRVREQIFVMASTLAGCKRLRVLVSHIVPNIFPSLLTFGLLLVPVAIIVEAALSFLGLGVPPPAPSWGNMIAVGQQTLASNPYLVLVPSACIFAVAASFNLLGDALRAHLAEEL